MPLRKLVFCLLAAQCSASLFAENPRERAFDSDWRFSPERSREIVNALVRAKKKVTYAEIEAHHGHDAFLIPIERYQEVFGTYMQEITL